MKQKPNSGRIRFVLVPYGSAGDVYPFLWMGRHLQDAGHQVLLAASPVFAGAAKKAGISMVPVGTEKEFHEMTKDPSLWDSRLGPWKVMAAIRSWFAEFASLIERSSPAHRTVLLASAPNFAAWFTARKLGIPLITVHLQPVILFSVHATPLLMRDFEWFQKMPAWFKGLLHVMPSPADIVLGGTIRKACKSVGIPPPKRLLRDWWNSPEGVLCLFPQWFAAPQPDWPQNLTQLSFPCYDVAADASVSADLHAFLESGTPPVAFTMGSAMRFGRNFFETAARACAELGVRGIFLSGYEEQIPPNLPPEIFPCSYAPFSHLFPKCRLVVHHGGIGTIAAGVRAGIPHVTVPLSHDQPDNAARLHTLGIGRTVDLRKLSPTTLAAAMRELLESASVAENCRKFAEDLRDTADLNPAPAILSFVQQTGKFSQQQLHPSTHACKPDKFESF